MPTYQYKCPSCGHAFEEFQSMTEAALEKCPQCGEKPERLISGGAGLLFKGSGFYITDYRSSAYKSAASSDSGTSASKPADSGSSSSPSTGSSSKAGAPSAPTQPAKPTKSSDS